MFALHSPLAARCHLTGRKVLMLQHTPSISRSRAMTFTTAAAMAAVFAIPAVASADITSTNVLTPAPESVFDSSLDLSGGPVPEPIEVTGTAVGAVPGDEVLIACTIDVGDSTLLIPLVASPVPVEDGAFSSDASIPPLTTCRVRAVPFEDDGSLLPVVPTAEVAAFTGPRVRGGIAVNIPYSESGDPEDPTADTYLSARGHGRGLVATTGLAPLGIPGGLGGGILASATIEDTNYRLLLGPSGGLSGFGGFSETPDPTDLANAPLIVDGAASYLVPIFEGQVAQAERTVDPVTGVTTIVESAPVVKAIVDPDPEGSGSYIPAATGVRLERTTVQDHDGRQIRIADTFRSLDGAAHGIQATYSQSVISDLFERFAGELPEGAEIPGLEDFVQEGATFRIPWVTGDEYRTWAAGQEFGPAPGGRSTIWVHGPRLDFSALADIEIPATLAPTFGAAAKAATRAGSAAKRADGPAPRAEGAITFEDAPSKGTFLSDGAFAARFVRDVPAGGTTSIRQTYSQDTTVEGVKELVGDPDPGPGTTPPPPSNVPLPSGPAPLPVLPKPFDPLPTLARSTGRVLLTPAQGRRLRDRKPVTVTTKGMPAGRYGVTIRRRVPKGRTIASGIKTIRQDGELKVTLRLTKYGRKYLAQKKTRKAKSVPVRVIVTWTPPGQGRKRQQTSYPANFR